MERLSKIVGTIAVVAIVVIAGLIVYDLNQHQKKEPIPELIDASLSKNTVSPANVSYLLNFSSPFSINPKWIQLAVSSGDYSSILTYSGDFSSSGFEFVNFSGLPNIAYISNRNGSSYGIFSGATITILPIDSHAYTKYGLSLEVVYNNLSGPTASVLPVSLTGSLTFIKSYVSTAPSGQHMSVAEVYMNFTPSPLVFMTVTLDLSGSQYILNGLEYTQNASWPSNQPEDIFTNIVNNVSEGPHAYSPYVVGTFGELVPTNAPLYVAIPYSSEGFVGDTVSISSSSYNGNLEVAL